VALVTSDRKLLVVSSDFSRNISEYDLSTDIEADTPLQVVWSGVDTVVLAWGVHVLMVGPLGETLRFVPAFCHHPAMGFVHTPGPSDMSIPTQSASLPRSTAPVSSVGINANSYRKYQVRVRGSPGLFVYEGIDDSQ
jgi:hypothetical protein